MKKLTLLLLVLLPVLAMAQTKPTWSIVPSVALGGGKMGKDTYDRTREIYGVKTTTAMEPKLSVEAAVSARMTVKFFYASAGLGVQSYQSTLSVVTFSSSKGSSSTTKSSSLNAESIYFPVMVGFKVPSWKVYPVAEFGANFAFPVHSSLDENQVASMVPQFALSGGLGFAVSPKVALEAKLHYVSTDHYIPNDYYSSSYSTTDSSWQYVSGQLSLVVNL